MKKVLMIGITPPIEGGSERHIAELCSRVENCDVLTQQGSSAMYSIELPIPKKPTRIRNLFFAWFVKIYTLYLLLKFNKEYDIIHIHENLLYFLVPWLRLRYKVIVTVHGIKGFKFYDKKILWMFFKTALKSANKIIAVNREDEKFLGKEFGKKKVVYIPNGVDLEVYKKIKTKKIENKIVFIGRIHKQKGIKYLLNAFIEINKRYPNFKLEIIGKLNNYAYKLKNQYNHKDIIWKGYIEDKEKIVKQLKSAFCIVLPSLWEGLPLTLLESLASSRPVIVSDIPAYKSIIKNEAIFFKVKDIRDLKNKIKELIDNKKKADKIGKKGEKMSINYDWNNIAKKLDKVYNSLR